VRNKYTQLLEKAKAKLRELEDSDPFWFYEPSTGVLAEEQGEFLREYLKPEDIPAKLDSQMDAHLCTAEIIGVSGGNQSSKSCTGCIEDLILATGELPLSLKDVYPKEKLPKSFPQRIRVTGVSEDQLQNSVFPLYRFWAPRQYLKGGSWEKSFASGKNTLYLYRNGKEISSIEFKTNRQDVETFQGPPLTKATYDEEPKSAIYEENLVRFTTSDRLRVQFNWTPTQGLTWATDLFDNYEDSEGNNVEKFELCPVLNPKANLETLRSIYDKILKQYGYDVLKRRLLGKAISLSGLVYGGLFSRAHIIPAETLYKNGKLDYTKYIVYRGLDPHLVTPTWGVEVAVDREGFHYVVGTYTGDGDTEVVKRELAERAKARNYRLGKTKCDKSADSTIHALSDRNIFQELGRGKNAIPALDTSDKFIGSIHAGVDQIKQLLLPDIRTNKPRFYILDLHENKPLIQSMRLLERDTYANEDKMGPKDRIAEGRHHAHAALRYVFQMRLNWIPESVCVPQPEPEGAYI